MMKKEKPMMSVTAIIQGTQAQHWSRGNTFLQLDSTMQSSKVNGSSCVRTWNSKQFCLEAFPTICTNGKERFYSLSHQTRTIYRIRESLAYADFTRIIRPGK
ncbi:hypothetical protein K0M31_007408 [Melipona bicolor]|uniref:Uncharacterized protein n=1 Tax=Melipona bicolor TaxID=60889 RepID=A0AA40KVP5_9HYME|nr:hypothetical protein K0M31_007408 [Melipona bicolor]